METNVLHEDFRNFLLKEFNQRVKANQRYSLRSFARDLDTNPGCLSVLLKGKRPFTDNLVEHFCEKLNLSERQFNQFLSKIKVRKKVPKHKVIKSDLFNILSEWYYNAICELTQTYDFKNNPNWVAKKLGISPAEALLAINRLKKQGWLAEENGQLILKNTDTEFNLKSHNTTAPLKRLQIQALEKSKKAIEREPLSRRYHATQTMAIDSSRIEEAKEVLRKFRQEFCLQIQNEEDQLTDVYQLNLGFYPLTEIEK